MQLNEKQPILHVLKINRSKEIKIKESTDYKIDTNFKKRDYSKVLHYESNCH